MKTEVRLREAIKRHKQVEDDYQRSRESLRAAVRTYLVEVTAERGSLVGMADRLGISMGTMANIKSGLGAVSPEWAEKLLAAAPQGRQEPQA